MYSWLFSPNSLPFKINKLIIHARKVFPRLLLKTWKDYSSIHYNDFTRKTLYREVLLAGLLHIHLSTYYLPHYTTKISFFRHDFS